MYEDDTPPEERRAQALSLDRGLLRELMGVEELRELLDAARSSRSRRRSGRRRGTPTSCTTCSGARGPLLEGEYDPGFAETLLRERRAIAAAARRRGAAGRRRGRGPRPRRARRRCRPVACRRVPRARARTRCRRSCAVSRGRTGRSRPPRSRRASGSSSQRGRGRARGARARREARPRRASARRHRARVVRPGRPAPHPARDARRRCAARSSRPTRPRSVASCPPGTGSGVARRCARRSCRCRALALPVSLWESDVLPRRVPGYRPADLDALCASGDVVWVGAGLDRVACTSARTLRCSGRPPSRRAPEGEAHARFAPRSAAGALFWADLLAATELEPADALPALWDLVWAGEVTNDSWAPLRASRRYEAPRPERGPAALLAARALRAFADAGPVVARGASLPGEDGPDRRALAELLLERQGIVTRDGVRGEGIQGGYGAVYGELARARDARSLPARVLRRGARRRAVRAARARSSGCASCGCRSARPATRRTCSCSPPPIPPSRTARPSPGRGEPGARAARVAGAWVVLLDGEAALFVERGGRSLVPLREPEPEWLRPALAALVAPRPGGGSEAARRRALRRRAGRRDRGDAAARRVRASSPARGAPSLGRRLDHPTPSWTARHRRGERCRRGLRTFEPYGKERARACAAPLSAASRLRPRRVRRARARARGGRGAPVRVRGARPAARARPSTSSGRSCARSSRSASRVLRAREDARSPSTSFGASPRLRSSRAPTPGRARARTTRSFARCCSGCSSRPPSRAAGSTGTTRPSSMRTATSSRSLFGERRQFARGRAAHRAVGRRAGRPRARALDRRLFAAGRALDALARVAWACCRRDSAASPTAAASSSSRRPRRGRRSPRRARRDRRRGERDPADDLCRARRRPGPLRDARRPAVRDPPGASDRRDAAAGRAVAPRRVPHADRRRRARRARRGRRRPRARGGARPLGALALPERAVPGRAAARRARRAARRDLAAALRSPARQRRQRRARSCTATSSRSRAATARAPACVRCGAQARSSRRCARAIEASSCTSSTASCSACRGDKRRGPRPSRGRLAARAVRCGTKSARSRFPRVTRSRASVGSMDEATSGAGAAGADRGARPGGRRAARAPAPSCGRCSEEAEAWSSTEGGDAGSGAVDGCDQRWHGRLRRLPRMT